MFMRLRKTKAQGTAEYAILISLVAAAVIGMQTYVKRGLQAGQKVASNDYTARVGQGNVNWTGINLPGTVVPEIQGQFEPDFIEAKTTETTLLGAVEERTRQRSGMEVREDNKLTKQGSDDYQKYNYTGPN